MIQIRKSDERGSADHKWLLAKHTFSFADYYDPKFMQFRTLRVINEDRVNPGSGFPTHGHRDMEIITYIISGALEHKDSMGNGSIIKPGDIQYMSAGSGVRHSEYNPSQTEPVHLLQIWINPNASGEPPAYRQTTFPLSEKLNKLCLVVSGKSNQRMNSIAIKQDVEIYACHLQKSHSVNYQVRTNRGFWLQIIQGKLTVNQNDAQAGDGLYSDSAIDLEIKAQSDSEFLLFDL
jgi:redox-sensitive bicupin YhaK (pirin superfamily)